MDIILNRQKEILQEIEKININFKKDGPSRRTTEYIKKKQEKLESLFKELEDNDRKLSQIPNPKGDYFEQKRFDQIRAYYTSTLSLITSYQPIDEVQAATAAPTFEVPTIEDVFQTPPKQNRASNSKTDELMKKQASNFRAFTRTIENINLESVSEKWEFEDLLRNLQMRWSVIDSVHWELDSELDGSNTVYEKAYTNHERNYLEMKKSINNRLWSVTHRERYTPQMDIPEFSGNYHHWESFKDLFREAIHGNASLSDAQKMQFLKSKVKGEAERLIQHLPITSDNYKTSWEILNHRYNNKKLIFNSHINIMMNIAVMQQPSVNHIKRIHDTTNECLNAIKNLGVEISTWDPLLVHLLSQKLDTQTYNDYMESLKQPRELPSLKEFLDFLESKFTIMEASRRKQDSTPPKAGTSNQLSSGMQYHKPNHFKQSYTSNQNNAQLSTSNKICPQCNEEHGIFYCKQFLRMPPMVKRKTIAKLNLCYNCLYNHYGKPCISTKRCRECNGNHNTILHEAFKGSNSTPRVGAATTKPEQIEKEPLSDANAHVSQTSDMPEILLATALVKVQALDGTYHTMRALIDQGSQLSLITESAAQRLSLPRQKCRGIISGVGIKESSSKGQININCLSMDDKHNFNIDALIMKSLVRNLPNQTFTKTQARYQENIQLADPEYNISRPVDLLLGAEVYSNIILEGICRGTTTEPVAQQTRLGWILFGNVPPTYQCNVVLNNLDDLEKFWEIEDITETSKLSLEDYQCIQYYQDTTTRMKDGRYEVRLPLKSDYAENIGASKNKAVAQFLQIEQKLHKQLQISYEYRQFIKEYQQLKHMKPATSNKTPDCYLPHHCVLREESTTTALRVVFNASAQTSSGKSLNDLMSRGPNLQQDLQSLILKWRQYKVAFTADIEKMFRQIWVHEDDQALQKIIWRDSMSEPIREHQLTTVTYGTKAAPFLAMMTLKQLAKDEFDNYQNSLAPKVVDESFYMDDLIHGSHSLSEARKLQQDLISLLKAGGFNLRKWSSNYQELLQDDSKKQTTTENNFEFRQPESTKTLGLHWNPKNDNFSFQSKIKPVYPETKITKRTLLSDVSKIFDPLGWLTPLTTKLKLLFQKVWLLQLQWEDKLPNNIITEWEKIRADITNINKIQVPRWLGIEQESNIELHGYCDAGISAYACVIYCKINQTDKPVLIMGKARVVSQKKKVSLPRLELCGAELLSRLMSKVLQCFPGYTVKTFGWTDSTAVLGWIQGDSNRWKPFVANRVQKINNIIKPECWRYVKSAENPADCASRGITATQLHEHPLWWNGPSWLPSFEPKNCTDKTKYQTDEEVKKTKQVNTVIDQQTNESIIMNLLNRYSSFRKIVRVLAWVRRFLSKKQERRQECFLTVQELQAARTAIIKEVQKSAFETEIDSLKRNKQISAKSKLIDFNPYLDNSGLLRVGGRLAQASISEDMKHPMIIPNKSILTTRLIDDAHSRTFHGGARLTLSKLREKYWIIGGNRAVKKRLQPCIICRKNKPSKQYQLMGDLPAPRVRPSRPFYHTGVDFTGHVEVKTNKGRGVKTTKGYIAVFICMVTKAVHLELVSDMTSAAFLAALRRLSARRGAPRHIYSDNGSNFIGGSRTINQEFINLYNLTDPAFHKEIADMEIEWHFQAPSWPSAGGIWESAVRCLKYHLRRVLGEQKLTYEEYATLLSQLEACLNTRPLCALSEDPEDLNYLTPSHFLASGPTLTIVETERDERTRWQHTQKIFNDIWKRWHSEYLAQLSARSKWKSAKENIKVNDVVLIHDANLPAGKWSMGRVLELHPGKDGYVRVVTLKTKNGLMKRPIVKLSILPVKDDEESENQPQQARNSNTTTQKQKKRNLFSTTLLALIYVMTMLTTCLSQKITPLNQDQGIYFDRVASLKLIQDEWKIIVYYDMDPYWKGILTYTKYADYLESTCAKIKVQTHCDVITLQLQHTFTELKYYDGILRNQHTHARQRRALINGVGYIAHSLFGVLDEEFAEQYAKDIALTRENEHHLALLWNNQTSIVEAEYNLLKRTEKTVQKQNQILNQQLMNLKQSTYAIREEINAIEYTNEFTILALSAYNMLSNLKNIQDTLLDSITNVYNGKFNIHLITPQQLQEELNTIAGQLSQDKSLPVSNIQAELQNIYHLLRIRTKMTDKYLIFEIKIPLISRDSYELYKTIAIPKQIGNNMVTLIPISDHIGINLQRDSYIPISQNEIQECRLHDSSTYMCQVHQPIYKMKTDLDLCVRNKESQCRSNIEFCKNEWTALNNINTFFYFCCDSCQLKTICTDQVTATQLTRANIINLPEDCMIKTDNFSVSSHKTLSSKLNLKTTIDKIEIPQINHIVKIPVQPTIINTTNQDSKETDQVLADLGQRIEQMKNSDVLTNRISYHDIHHYSAIYGMIAITCIVAAYVIYRRVRSRRASPDPAPAGEAPADNSARTQQIPQPLCRSSNSMKDMGTTPVLQRAIFNEDTV